MFRLALILLMLIQPFQWAWANVHITADAAHSVSHSAMEALDPALESLISLSSWSVPDDGIKSEVNSGVNGSVNGSVSGHTCHDNNFHHTTVLGLGGEVDALLLPGLHAVLAHSQLAAFDSVSPGSIERPKWFATR